MDSDFVLPAGPGTTGAGATKPGVTGAGATGAGAGHPNGVAHPVDPSDSAGLGAPESSAGPAGPDGMPPGELIRVIATAIRNERARAGLSLSELAKRAGIAKSTLSQLESGSGNPSVETLWALGVALGVPFSRLVDPPRPRVQVIRAGEGPAIYSERAHYTATLLAARPPGVRHDMYLITAQPGPPRDSAPHMPGATEHVVLGTGRALVGPSTDPVELRPGDYICYPGDVPHIFKALVPDTTAMLTMEYTS